MKLTWIVAATIALSGQLAWAQAHFTPEPSGFQCNGDRKVWVNTRSRIYHLQGQRYYGSTANGEYLCEKQARAEGDRETRNGM